MELTEEHMLFAVNAHLAAQINLLGRIAERMTMVVDLLKSIEERIADLSKGGT